MKPVQALDRILFLLLGLFLLLFVRHIMVTFKQFLHDSPLETNTGAMNKLHGNRRNPKEEV